MLEHLVQLEAINEEETSGTIYRCGTFNPDDDAMKLHEAVKGLGTDEEAIIDVLSARKNKQRQEIKNSYKQQYGADLEDDLGNDTSGDFKKLILALLDPPVTYEAKSIRNAMKGIGTNETVLTEILCSRNNRELRAIRNIYKKLYDCELEDDIESDTSGDFRRLLVSLCNGDRDEGTEINLREAAEDADDLYCAGEGRSGTNEDVFNRIFCKKSYAQLRATFSEYYRLASKDITEAIESEFSGDLKQGLLAIAHVARCRPAFFAIRLYNTMKGLGTDDSNLIRLVVSRSEIDMSQVKKAFNLMYCECLDDFIKDDTSGDYQKLLLELI